MVAWILLMVLQYCDLDLCYEELRYSGPKVLVGSPVTDSLAESDGNEVGDAGTTDFRAAFLQRMLSVGIKWSRQSNGQVCDSTRYENRQRYQRLIVKL